MEELKILKRRLRQEAVICPDFIDPMKVIDRDCFEMSGMIFFYIEKLMSEYVLTTGKIKTIEKKIEELLSNIGYIDGNIGIAYYSYFQLQLKDYLNYCLEEELYETASNIRDVYKKLYEE
jgi:protein-arginine kinase activator protein McsA